MILFIHQKLLCNGVVIFRYSNINYLREAGLGSALVGGVLRIAMYLEAAAHRQHKRLPVYLFNSIFKILNDKMMILIKMMNLQHQRLPVNLFNSI